jgi:hypothetical protein
MHKTKVIGTTKAKLASFFFVMEVSLSIVATKQK